MDSECNFDPPYGLYPWEDFLDPFWTCVSICLFITDLICLLFMSSIDYTCQYLKQDGSNYVDIGYIQITFCDACDAAARLAKLPCRPKSTWYECNPAWNLPEPDGSSASSSSYEARQ